MPPTRSAKTKTPLKTRPASANSTASSSKVTLDSLSPLDLPESITPGYKYVAREEPQSGKEKLTEEERAKLIHELVGFNPIMMCKSIVDAARDQVYPTLDAMEEWARKSSGHNPKLDVELNAGLVAMETLLESHVDRAFDKFTAWVLRNAFEFSPELEVVLPWQKGLDFSRGEYIASQPKGQVVLDETLDDLRKKVEQARYLAQRLDIAERKLDRRIEIAKQRKAEVGFIQEIVESAGLNPLPNPTSQLLPTLQQLHTSLQPLDPLPSTYTPPSTASAGADPGASLNSGHTKAWELGRAAYLNWALGKVVRPTPSPSAMSQSGSGGGAGGIGGNLSSGAGAGGPGGEGDKLEVIERGIVQVTGGDPNAAEKALNNV